MKDTWEIVKIGDVCSVVAGQSPKGSFYNQEGKGLPFYQGKKQFGAMFIGKPTTWTTQVTKEALPGDILMSVRAPVGPVNFSTQRICIGRGLAAIRAGEKIDRMYLYYSLLLRQDEIKGNEGAVFASINKRQIENIELLLPPLPEQKRMVSVLDEAFEGIEKAINNTQRKLAALAELKQSLLQKAFSGELTAMVTDNGSERLRHE